MWKQKEATNLSCLFLIITFSGHFLEMARALSDKRLCADENCKEIISLGTGTINYQPGEVGTISFKANSVIRIKSKSAGSDPSLWGIEVNGREGYAPKRFIREFQIIVSDKNLKFEVDVKPKNSDTILSTSEKLVEQQNALEATTTTPLNRTPSESTESVLNKNSNDNIAENFSVIATPVKSDNENGTEVHDKIETSKVETKTDDEATGSGEVGKGEKEPSLEIIEKQNIFTESGTTNDIKQHSAEEPNQENGEVVEQTFNQTSSEKGINDTSNDTEKYTGVVENNNQEQLNDNEIQLDANKLVSDAKNEKTIQANEISAEANGVPNSNLPTNTIDAKRAETILLHEKQAGGTDFSKNLSHESETSQSTVGHENNRHLKYVDNVEDTKELYNNNTEENSSGATKDPIQKSHSNVSHSTITNHMEQHVKQIVEEHKQENWKSFKQTSNQPSTLSEKEISATANGTENYTGILKDVDQEQLKDKEVQVDAKKLESVARNEERISTSSISAEKNETVMVNSTSRSVEEEKSSEHNSLNEKHVNQTESAGSLSQESAANQTRLANYENDTHLEHSDNEIETDERYSDNRNHKISKVSKDKLKDYFHQNAYENHISENLKKEITETDNSKTDKETLAQHMSTDETTYSNSDGFKESQIKESTNAGRVTEKIRDEDDHSSSNPEGVISDTNDQNADKVFREENVLEENVNPSTHRPTTNPNDFPNHSYDQINFDHSEADIQKQTTNNFTDNLTYSNSDGFKESHIKELTNAGRVTELIRDEEENLSSNPEAVISDTNDQNSDKVFREEDVLEENVNPSTLHPTIKPNDFPNHNYDQQITFDHSEADIQKHTTDNYNSVPAIVDDSVSRPYQVNPNEKSELLPSTTPHPSDNLDMKENEGLFATIMGTVNNMLATNKKNKQTEFGGDLELDKILHFPTNVKPNTNEKLNEESSFQYCQNIGANGDCPESEENQKSSNLNSHHTSSLPFLSTDFNFDTFLKNLASKILEISELLAFLVIAAAASLFFIFGYYCFCNSSREGALLSKLNQMESSLLASHKENAILKHNLMSTRQKLTSIEDNSFGSNDMVVSLKKELEEELLEKARLQEQITVLQKELENAADAGIELNKIVSELLSNQTGDESIISSVEELQKQLNEQQNTIYEINASLAEKSRENSELQLMLAEQNARYEAELANLQRDNDELDQEKGNLITRLEEMRTDFDKDITAALEGKNLEIKRQQNEILDLGNKLENEHTKWQTSVAKIEALEECLKNVRKDPSVNINEVIDVANVKAQLIETQKKYNTIKEKLETQSDCRKLAENQLEIVSREVEKLKQDFNQSEKDKLEAQTRLEVLSNYFKDKENQLQKELSLKEAMWLKQQGETTTTVDRVTAMQEEIQSLRSQNDSLRAEIEAQVAAHKAQTGTLENRAHETWLAARQSDRRYEEARAEATALRRKLTALAGGNVNEANKPSTGSAALGDELAQAPSPIHMESPGSPLLGRLPPPPFLPPPFMGPPPPFMSMPPPPPFVPHGEMRPAPLGRIMSPPPQRSGRFSPQRLDYEDYLDYESNNTWHRHTYSPPPRTYRSLSPTDSRYNYGNERDLISTYDTETDFSPPPSPRESRRRGGNSSERIDSNTKTSYGNAKKFNTSNKGPLSSGSEKSFNTLSHNDVKTKKGNTGGGVKHLV